MPSPVRGVGACLQKKNQFCAKCYAILNKFWYFFPILQQKVWGGLSPSPKSGGPIPLSHLLRCLWVYHLKVASEFHIAIKTCSREG